MKECKKCLVVKTFDEFHKQSRRKDGKHPWCKDCCKNYQKENMDRRLELESKRWYEDAEYREKRKQLQRNWTAKNIEYKRKKEKENRIKNPAPYKKRAVDYANKNPEEIKITAKARQAVYRAIKKGSLVRPTECEWCAVECKPEGAHHDYEKPLDVKWLCRPCHAKWDYHEPKIMKKES